MNSHIEGFIRGAMYGVIVMITAMALIALASCTTPDSGSYKPGYLVKRSRCCTGIVVDFGSMTSVCEVVPPCSTR